MPEPLDRNSFIIYTVLRYFNGLLIDVLTVPIFLKGVCRMKRLLLSMTAVAAGLISEPAQACSRLWHRSDCRCDQRPAAQARQVYETPPQVERHKVGEIFEERVTRQRVIQWETWRQIVVPVPVEADAVPPAPKVQRQLAPPVQPAPVPPKPQPQSPSPREKPAPAGSPTAVVWTPRSADVYCSSCRCVHTVGRCVKRVVGVVVGTTLDIGGTTVDVVGTTVGTTIHAGGAIVTGAADRVVGLFDRTRERFGDRTRRDSRWIDFPDCRN